MQKLTTEKLVDSFCLAESKDHPWEVVDVNEGAEPSRVDGVHILARVQGPFFLVEGTSLNRRFYSKKLWENAINKVGERFQRGGLLGAVGHDQPLDDKALAEGKLSHIVTKLWINEQNIGMGEILILGTDSGRQLNTLLRAGVPLPVSSRAYGKISGQNERGEDVIDPDSFILETFDFVLNPGVSSAYVRVVENITPANEEEKMDLIQKLTEEKLDLQSKLTEALLSNQQLNAKLLENNTQAESLKSTVRVYEENVGSEQEAKELAEGLRKYLELSPTKELAAQTGLLAQNGQSPAVVIKKLLGIVESLTSLGTKEVLSEKLSSLQKYEEMGSHEEITKVLDILEEYAKIGAPSRVRAVMEGAKKFAEDIQEAKRQLAAKKIAAKLEVNEEVALEMVKKMGVKATIENLQKLKECVVVTNRYKVTEGAPKSEPETNVVKGNFAERMFESGYKNAAVTE